jgi:hypothetical protein
MTSLGSSKDVFINCPFDPTYRPLFEGIVFATYDCGFYPRCSLEVDDSSEVRLEKLARIIRESRLAVHDISRTQLDRDTRLPRFNMPLELGLYLGAKLFGAADHSRKVAIILDADRYRYQKFISDIAGQDIRAHGGSRDEAIHQVRDFLSTHAEPGVFLPGGHRIVERYETFRDDLPAICHDVRLNPATLNFRDLTTLIRGWLSSNPSGSGMAGG